MDWRRDQEHGEYTQVAAKAWEEGRGIAEVTVRNRGSDKTPRFRIEAAFPGEGPIPQSSVLRWQISASDLSMISKIPLAGIKDAQVTLDDLVGSILIWGEAARLLVDEAFRHLPGGKARNFATIVDREELLVLRTGLGWTRTKAETVLDFFTYAGRTSDGVWSKPFVRHGKNGLIPIFSALAGPNLYRSAEIWLAEAGGDDLQRSRGLIFEDKVRLELTQAVAGLPFIETVKIAPKWSVKIGSPRDIDLAIRIGSTVFIADAKLKRFPAEPREAARWEKELKKGVDQVRLRCDFLTKNPQSAVEKTGYKGKPSELRFEPFVLVSGFFGAGTTIDDVPIIDFDGLKEFFDPGFFGAWGELGLGSEMRVIKSVPFWIEGDDIAVCFAVYLRDPVRIRTVERAMVPLPRIIGIRAADNRRIRCVEMMVDHLRFTNGHALYRDSLTHWNEARHRAGMSPIPDQ